ncbi:MAG: hypothetical protein ACO3A4_12250 [Silvanigrellaceae bacterium]
MNMKYLALAGVSAIALYSTPSYAAYVNFNFRVNSSGMDIYPCDAGLYDPVNGDGAAVFPTPSDASGSNTSYLTAQKHAWVDGWRTSVSSWDTLNLFANTSFGDSFKTVVYNTTGYVNDTHVFSKFGNIIRNVQGDDYSRINNNPDRGTGLVFNLASAKFGARYFVDFCVRNTKIPYPAATNYYYKINDEITAVQLETNGYLEKASVKVTGRIACDKRDGSWSSTKIKDSFSTGMLGLTGETGLSLNSTNTPTGIINGTTYGVFSNRNASSNTGYSFNSGSPLRYCVIRYVFEETATSQRLWDLQQAIFAIDLAFNNTGWGS